jgi:uncharacterized Zn finger protein
MIVCVWPAAPAGLQRGRGASVLRASAAAPDRPRPRDLVSTLEAFLPLFEPESLSRLATKKAYPPGVELFEARAVSDIVFDGNCLRGKVKGSTTMPHTATIKLTESGHVEAHCTCPTFTDGWEKFCHHAVALALAFRKQYQAGGDITVTQNPWVAEVTGSSANLQRYTIEAKKGNWHVITRA